MLGRSAQPATDGACTAAGPRPGAPATGTPRVAAFFDVDNTLVKGSALFHVCRSLIRHGYIRRLDIARYGLKQVMFRLRGEHHGHMTDVRDSALQLAKGLPVAELVALGEQVYDHKLARRLCAGAVRMAQEHVRAGEAVWLVSAAPVELIEMIARRIGVTGGLGTIAEVRAGAWTGRLVNDVLHGPAKAVAVRALAAEQGFDLSRCAAYSDSINDLPLLDLVGQPHAVNPDRHLRAVARQRGWPVHLFGARLPVTVAVARARALLRGQGRTRRRAARTARTRSGAGRSSGGPGAGSPADGSAPTAPARGFAQEAPAGSALGTPAGSALGTPAGRSWLTSLRGGSPGRAGERRGPR